MKIASLLAIGLVTLGAVTVLSQPQPAQPAPPVAPQPPRPPIVARNANPEIGELTRFDLDFPGGRPAQLVEAIQKALGKPLNAIIPDEFADARLPALKMKNVDVSQLFQALQAATSKTVSVSTGNYGGPFGATTYQHYQTSCGFRSKEGRITDDTIWYFFVDRPAVPEGASAARPKTCRFYSLAPYLEGGVTVDDITTAIETGWKMLGEPSPASINFHKDTKLLIAVGEPSALEIIDSVLNALGGSRPPTPAPPGTPALAPAPRRPAKPPVKPAPEAN